MDNLKQVGKVLKRIHDEGNINIRRIGENFPDVHRNIDSVSPVFGYRMEFPTTKHPHSVHLDLHLREMVKPCVVEAPELFVAATAQCGLFPGSDGAGGYEVSPGFLSNVGGFILNPAGGMIVPLSGYYNVNFLNSIGGVNVDGGSFIHGEIRVDGATVASQVFSAGHGYNPPLSFTGPQFDLWATGIYISEGSTVSGWLQEFGIAFWTPSDLCFLGGSHTTVVYVGSP